MTDGELLEVVGVQQTIYRYSDAVSRADWEQFASVYAPDAVWEITGPMPIREVGPEAITNAMRGMLQDMEFFFQLSTNVVVDIVGPGRARAMTTTYEMGRHAGVFEGRACGVYQDELEKQDGTWKFTHRRFYFSYFENAPLPGAGVTPRTDFP